MTVASSSFPSGSRAHRNKLFSLLIVAFLLRVGFEAAAGELGRSPPVDYREYVTVGTRLLEFGTLTSPFISEGRVAEPSSLLPPAYAFVVAMAYGALGIESSQATLALQLINAVATTLVVLLVFHVGDALGGRRVAWVAAIVAAFNPLLFGHTGLIWDTYLFALGLTIAVWLSVRFGERGRDAWRFFSFGAYLGLLAMLNPAFTLGYPLLILWPCIRRRLRWRSTGALCVAAMLGWSVAIAPWTIRNYRQFDEFIYVRGGFAFELWLGACPEAESDPGGMYYARFPLKNAELQRRINEIGEAAFLAESRQQAKAAIKADPLRFLRLCGLRAVDFWFGTTRTHSQPPEMRWWPSDRKRLSIALFLSAETLLVLGILFWPFRRRSATLGHGDVGFETSNLSGCWWLASLAVLFSLVYCLTHVELRFRVPIEPILAVLVGMVPWNLGLALTRKGTRCDLTSALQRQ